MQHELPSPLREVFAYESVTLSDSIIAALGHSETERAQGAETCQSLRLEVYGLPGMGKTTLSREVLSVLRARGLDALLLPEAVPYAVRVLGIQLADLEPFLDLVNAQAETLARRVCKANSNIVVIRDPAHQQNETYRFVLHALREDRGSLANWLARLGDAAGRGAWDQSAARETAAALWNRHPELRNPPLGPWRLGHLLLTTGNPVADFELSISRQRTDGRDPGLVTDNPSALAGYLAVLSHVEAETRRATGAPRLVVDPEAPDGISAGAVLSAMVGNR